MIWLAFDMSGAQEPGQFAGLLQKRVDGALLLQKLSLRVMKVGLHHIEWRARQRHQSSWSFPPEPRRNLAQALVSLALVHEKVALGEPFEPSLDCFWFVPLVKPRQKGGG